MGIPPVQFLGLITPRFGAKKSAKSGRKAAADKRTLRSKTKKITVKRPATNKTPKLSQAKPPADEKIVVTPTNLARIAFELANKLIQQQTPPQPLQLQSQATPTEKQRKLKRQKVPPRGVFLASKIKQLAALGGKIDSYDGQINALNNLYGRMCLKFGELILADCPNTITTFKNLASIDSDFTKLLDFGVSPAYMPKAKTPEDKRKLFLGRTVIGGYASWAVFPDEVKRYKANLKKEFPEVFKGNDDFWSGIRGMKKYVDSSRIQAGLRPLKKLKEEEKQDVFHSFMNWLTQQVRERPKVVLAALPDCREILYAFADQGVDLGEVVPRKYDDRKNLVTPGPAWHQSLLSQAFLIPIRRWSSTKPLHDGPERIAAATVLSFTLANAGEFNLSSYPTWQSIRYARQKRFREYYPGIIRPNDANTNQGQGESSAGSGVSDD